MLLGAHLSRLRRTVRVDGVFPVANFVPWLAGDFKSFLIWVLLPSNHWPFLSQVTRYPLLETRTEPRQLRTFLLISACILGRSAWKLAAGTGRVESAKVTQRLSFWPLTTIGSKMKEGEPAWLFLVGNQDFSINACFSIICQALSYDHCWL